MIRRFPWVGVLGFALLCFGGTAHGVIMRLTPLKEVIAVEQFIFLAKVDKLDPDKKTMVLVVADDLKEKIPCRRLPVNMTGDSESKKKQQVPQLFERLAAELPVVVFASRHDKQYTAFVFSNGTWFQMTGRVDEDPATVRWSLTHGEPYLRRTFKGTTAELKQIVVDGLAKKKDPPEPDTKAEPGFGPAVAPKDNKKEGDGKRLGAAALSRCLADMPKPAPWGGGISLPLPAEGNPRFAVIPTVFVMGPLALLATLFPAVFGGFQRRWLVLLSMLSLLSTLYVLYFLFRGTIKDYWWGNPSALWIGMAGCALIGVVWSWRRSRAMAQGGEASELSPRPWEVRLLQILSALGVALLVFVYLQGDLFRSPWKELLLFWSCIWVGAIYAFLLAFRRPEAHPTFTIEAVMLASLVCACAGQGAVYLARRPSQAVEVAWLHEAKNRGRFDSSPVIAGERIYQAMSLAGLASRGDFFCLDRSTGQEIWHFNDEGGLRGVFCTPCLAEGKVYIGEGYHQDSDCRLFCLDAETGKKIWEFLTESHTESSPTVVAGKVYFGAGDDGVYCLDAATGQKLWQFFSPEGPHVDSKPAIAGKHLFSGSGYGKFEIFCLDIDTGKPVWRKQLDLPAFGSPLHDGEHVLFGIGNGDLTKSDPTPAGALLCVDAATGEILWRYGVPDTVLAKPAVVDGRVYFGSRDGHLYCVDRKDGKFLWKHDMGSAVVTAPAISSPSTFGADTDLYAVASAGRVCCLNPNTGKVIWSWEVGEHSEGQPQMYSSPIVADTRENDQTRRRIYFGSGLDNVITFTATLFCLEDKLAAR